MIRTVKFVRISGSSKNFLIQTQETLFEITKV